ncbi:MAG: hypothetical protein C3F15_15565 [Holophagae bacterium]|nr:MAG: hypothetical protein C3F15_15565 [Holophagae bacterium]
MLLVGGAGLSVLVGCGRSDRVASVESQTEQTTTGQAQGDDELAARERALAEREAELNAREAELARQQGRPFAPAPPAAAAPSSPAAPPDQPAAAGSPPVPASVPPTPTPAPIPVTLAAGTLVTVEFQQKLSSHESTVGQTFSVRVVEPVRVAEGIAIPTGSVVSGKVTEAKPAKKIGGSSRLAVEFVSVRLAGGETLPFAAAFSSKGKSSTGKDVGIIAGAAAGGAILGNQVFDDDGGAKGALIGAAAGAIVASQTKAKPVEIAAGTVTNLELTQPISLKIRR